MASLRTNILANYAGQTWAILLGLAFVPLYLRTLGVESFGLISFMLSLQAMSQILDLGIGGSVNRELAQRNAHSSSAGGMRNLVRSFEYLVWSIAVLIALAIWLASPAIADHWLHPQGISEEETSHAVAMMAVAIAAFWPTGFYGGALSGLEKQRSLNLVNSVFATLRTIGVVPILFYISATASAFIAWSALIGVLHSATLAWLLWRKLPATDGRALFRVSEFRGTWRFAGGLFAIGMMSLILTQLDRLALSALRPLQDLGYYGLVISISAGLGRLVLPMFNALYPRFSRLVATGQGEQLALVYHLSSQYIAVPVAAIASVLVFFGRDVIHLWTGDAGIADRTWLPLAILSIGSALNGLMNVPYALQLAHGWTRVVVLANLIALAIAIPLVTWVVPRYGMAGAASIWLIANLGYFTILTPITMQRLMPGLVRTWYLRDCLPPFAASMTLAALLRILITDLPRTFHGYLTLALVCALVLAASIASCRSARKFVTEHVVMPRMSV
jgi:O-antigen/teichoic acid export membrane protein